MNTSTKNEEYTNEEKRVAELLHLNCPHNHTDYCGWYYGEHQREYNFKRGRDAMRALISTGVSMKTFEMVMEALYPKQYSDAANQIYKNADRE